MATERETGRETERETGAGTQANPPHSGAALPGGTGPRPNDYYSLALRTLHWLTALGMFANVFLAWTMTNLPRTPLRGQLFTVHKSIGLTILLLTLLRILKKLYERRLPLPPEVPRLEQTFAHIGHGLLYLILLAMPITGYLNSVFGGNRVLYFFMFPVPALFAVDKHLGHLFGEIHGYIAYAVYVLVAGHLSAVVYHQLIQRVDVLSRMIGRPRRF